METRRKMKLRTSDKLLLGIGYAVLGLFVLAIVIPLVYVVAASFMDPNVLNSQGISFDFKNWTLDAYRRVLENDMIWQGIFKFLLLFGSIYSDFCFYYAAGGISYVKKRVGGKKIFQYNLYYYDVFRRRLDSDIYFNKSASLSKYNMGNPASGRI